VIVTTSTAEFRAEQTEPRARATRGLICIQALLGIGAWLTLVLPYVRRTTGMKRLEPRNRYLFVANHVSLLDTIVLGGLCWRRGCYPILVLGDKSVWHASWLKRILSSRIGFLLDRGKLQPGRILELQEFARAGSQFHLVVFPEGTRGNGVEVGRCQPGLYHIAQEARLPMVPIFFENMQLVSTKTGRFHPFGGLRKVEVHFGEPISPDEYLPIARDEFGEFVRERISSLGETRGCQELTVPKPSGAAEPCPEAR
jgi:1-acyl-sn-glycerol-3-phosphate acyltransferase